MYTKSTDHRGAYSVDEFCQAHDLSRVTFYKLLKAGKGPRIMRVMTRTLISAEAAAEWRREMEEGAEVQSPRRRA
ncbi:MAG TPA: hypothetical protein PLN31_19650 [Azoarcus taiwanensis]|nr:hypothetical protein [Azoarcus taiwanensis]